MRSGGLLVGAATLKHHDLPNPRVSCRGAPDKKAAANAGARGSVYLSGYRIVQDALGTRHAEYRVVLVNARYERWHRFSEVKALARRLLKVPGTSITEASVEAWDCVRACKAPERRALDHGHLNRRCRAIEMYLDSLLENMSAAPLSELLAHVSTRRCAGPRTNNWGSGASPPPTHAARVSGIRMRMRWTRYVCLLNARELI